MNSGFSKIYFDEFVHDIHSLVENGGKLKVEIFKASISDREVNSKIPLSFLGSLNGLLMKYEKYANSFEELLRNNKIVADTASAIKYDDIKSYLYAKYDYASILQFTDGVIDGINEYEFKSQNDIDEFFKFTTTKAFTDRPDSVGQLVDDVNNILRNRVKTDSAESKYFTAVKGQKLFNANDRRIVNQSITKVIDYLIDQLKKNPAFLVKNNNMNLRIAAINNIVEYAVYTLTAYVSRIFILVEYGYEFISARYITTQVTESVSEVEHKVSQSCIDIMKNADDMAFRHPVNIQKFIDTIFEFANIVNVQLPFTEMNDRNYNYLYPNRDFEKNIFTSKAIANPLYEFIMNGFSQHIHEWNLQAASIIDSANIMKSFMYNTNHAIASATTAKQDLIHILNACGKDQCMNSLADMITFSAVFLSRIACNYDSLSSIRLKDLSYEMNIIAKLNTSKSELQKYLIDLYNESLLVIINRLRDIEVCINNKKNESLQKTYADISINVPGSIKKDNINPADRMSSVPNTTRMSSEVMNLYEAPIIESLQMYDEYIKEAYGLSGDIYFSEAFDFSNIINTLIAAIKARIKKFLQFITDQKFKAAIKWCNDHKEQLNKMTFSGTMEVLPFTKDINIEFLAKLTDTIKSFSENDVKDQQSLDNFILSLYGSKEMFDLFEDEGRSKIRNDVYKNYILFGAPLTANTSTIQKKQLNTSNEIKAELITNWLDDVSKADQLSSSMKTLESRYESAINSMKQKIVSITNNAKPANNTSNPIIDSMDTSDMGGTPDNSSDLTSNCQAALTKVQTVVNSLFIPIYDILAGALKTEYSYIQHAYQLGAASLNGNK